MHLDFDTHEGIVEWWLWMNKCPSRYANTNEMPCEVGLVFEHMVKMGVASQKGAQALAGAQAKEHAEMERLKRLSGMADDQMMQRYYA